VTELKAFFSTKVFLYSPKDFCDIPQFFFGGMEKILLKKMHLILTNPVNLLFRINGGITKILGLPLEVLLCVAVYNLQSTLNIAYLVGIV
jgi:hypothetical protein